MKDDFYNQRVDLYLLKKAASNLLYATSNFKMNENFAFSRFDQEELVELLTEIKKLIGAIEKGIEIPTKEKYYSSNNIEI